MTLSRFEDLTCWQAATALAVEIYAVSQDGDMGRDFGFRDQLRRSAVSIASNIAEGKERETIPELIRHLYIAKGSAGELRTQLYIAEQIRYLDSKQGMKLRDQAERISAQIGALIKTLKQKVDVNAS